MQDINAVMNKKVILENGTEIEGYKAWLCAMLLGTPLFKEYNLTIAYDVPVWKVVYTCNDGKYQSFDEMMEENCPDKKKIFGLVVCRESEVLVAMDFDRHAEKNKNIRLPLLSFDVSKISVETVKIIAEWLANKLTTWESGKYLYCPERNRKLRRIPLKRRLDMLEEKEVILEGRCM